MFQEDDARFCITSREYKRKRAEMSFLTLPYEQSTRKQFQFVFCGTMLPNLFKHNKKISCKHLVRLSQVLRGVPLFSTTVFYIKFYIYKSYKRLPFRECISNKHVFPFNMNIFHIVSFEQLADRQEHLTKERLRVGPSLSKSPCWFLYFGARSFEVLRTFPLFSQTLWLKPVRQWWK